MKYSTILIWECWNLMTWEWCVLRYRCQLCVTYRFLMFHGVKKELMNRLFLISVQRSQISLLTIVYIETRTLKQKIIFHFKQVVLFEYILSPSKKVLCCYWNLSSILIYSMWIWWIFFLWSLLSHHRFIREAFLDLLHSDIRQTSNLPVELQHQ